jgi:hypothetical protein
MLSIPSFVPDGDALIDPADDTRLGAQILAIFVEGQSCSLTRKRLVRPGDECSRTFLHAAKRATRQFDHCNVLLDRDR